MELKAYIAPTADGTGLADYYLKSNADKVIADKDKQLRHHKYKRCLDKARWCHDMWFSLRFDKEAKKSVFYWRWWNIWQEIADKLKEAK